MSSNERTEDDGEHRQSDQEIRGDSAEQSGGGPRLDLSYCTSVAQLQAELARLNAIDAAANSVQGSGGLIWPTASAAVVCSTSWYGSSFVTSAFSTAPDRVTIALADLPDDGVVVGEIEGWRAWRVDDGWLYSTTFDDYEWVPGEAAKGKADLTEGIHAFKTRKAAIQYHEARTFDCVVGKVALWGDMVEFDNGWHAQFAKPSSFDVYLNAYGGPRRKYDSKEGWLERQNAGAAELEALRQTYLDMATMPLPQMRA